MSVTITPSGNYDYCKANGLVKTETEECNCVWEGQPSRDCPCCNGTGTWNMERYPFEMDLANGNFSTLWNSLGLEPHDPVDGLCGEIDGRRILEIIRTFDEALLIRAEREDHKPGRCQLWQAGIHAEQAEGYLTRLKAIAEEAARREVPLVWF